MIITGLFFIAGLLIFMIAGCWAIWEPRLPPLNLANGRGPRVRSRWRE